MYRIYGALMNIIGVREYAPCVHILAVGGTRYDYVHDVYYNVFKYMNSTYTSLYIYYIEMFI